MFKNARKYYIENVFPSYQDFITHRASNDWGENQLLRKGVVAASALFHLREHIPDNIRPSKTDLRRQYPDYGLIGDITNVSKHRNISRDNPQITHASQIHENLRYIMFKDEEGEYWAPQLEVYVKLDNTVELKLINILYNVITMWIDILDNLGIKTKESLEPLIIDNLISRDEASKRTANLQIRRGEDYQWGFRVEKYNYENKIIEPMDLTGMKFKFQILKIPENAPVHIHVTNPKIGVDVELDFDIPLSEEQAKNYMRLIENEKKQKFLHEIVESTPSIKKDLQNKIYLAIKSKISDLSNKD